MRFVLALLVLAMGAPLAQAQTNWEIAGAWRGGYVCNQGLTALRVVITPDVRGEGVTATFHFGPDASNPGVPQGAFRMHGSFTKNDRRLQLTSVSWISQPDGYVMVDLDGLMRGSGLYISGDVIGAGCTRFELVRDDGARIG